MAETLKQTILEVQGSYTHDAITLASENSDLLIEMNQSWEREFERANDLLGLGLADLNQLPSTLEQKTVKELSGKKSSRNVIAVVGPGGTGKDTLIGQLGWKTALQTTTRARRDYEVDGRDYRFVTEGEFQAMNLVHTVFKPGRGWYGYTQEDIDDAFSQSDNIVIIQSPRDSLEIARKITAGRGEVGHRLIYVLPPSPVLPHLAVRLANRCILGGEAFTPEVIESTLGKRQTDEFSDVVDLIAEGQNVQIVVNDSIGRATEVLRNSF